MKKVYFAGSIRGGRECADNYMKIIDFLKHNFIVLTEHVGDKNLGVSGEVDKTDEYIYNRDCNWIREADFVVADVTMPSLGVGYEIRYAEDYNKPILCIYQNSDNKKISAMLLGNHNLEIHSYDNASDIFNIIIDFSNDIK
jgi:nucleoside 2-deoxyribosyltransferase